MLWWLRANLFQFVMGGVGQYNFDYHNQYNGLSITKLAIIGMTLCDFSMCILKPCEGCNDS